MVLDLSGTFAALGDRTRFAIVERLMAEGEMSAGDICASTSLSAPAVSRHLKLLCEAGILHRRIDAQRRLYAANPAALQRIVAWTGSYRVFWDQSLDRLEQALMKDDPHG